MTDLRPRFKKGDRVRRRLSRHPAATAGTVARIDERDDSLVWVKWDTRLHKRTVPREYRDTDLEHLSAVDRLGELLDD